MNLILIILFFAGLVGFIFFLINLQKKINIRANSAAESLEKNGYVIDNAYIKPNGELVRIWGSFEKATPFYIQVSNFDPISIAAGQFGIADIAVGDQEFDDNFVVRTNHPENAKKLLSDSVREIFANYRNIRFRTGAINSLLDADYFPKQKTDRDLRIFWMLEVSSPIPKEELDFLLQFANDLTKEIKNISNNWNAEINLRSSFFEGR